MSHDAIGGNEGPDPDSLLLAPKLYFDRYFIVAAFALAALVLGESVSLGMLGTAAAVMVCVAGGRRFG